MAKTHETRLKRLEPSSLAELAYESIRESIVKGRFEMGEQIVETRVAEELGVSRGPIREALRRLAEEQLVVERPRYGCFVREFTGRDFVDVYNLRIAIETAAIRLVTRRQPSLEQLEQTIREMEKAARRRRHQEVVDLELRLHQELCDASENAYISSVFRSLSVPVRIALDLDDAAYTDLEDVVTEHPPLLDVIRAGDEDRAARAIQEHIVASVGPVLERLQGDPKDLLRRV